MKIRNMRVNHLKNPLGYECEYPVFSWIVQNAKGKRQEKARMEIALDREMKKVVYDSGWKREINSRGFCPNVQISPRDQILLADKSSHRQKRKAHQSGVLVRDGKDGGAVAGAVDQCGF